MKKLFLEINNTKIPITIADTWSLKLKGLTFKNNINYGLIIPECISVHTFFMNDNIDIIFFDAYQTILFIYQNVPANKIVAIEENIKKTSVLELPKNTSKNLKIGDKLTFKFEDVI